MADSHLFCFGLNTFMIFRNSPDVDQFVKNELERLFKSYSYLDLVNDEIILHNFVFEFMQSSKKLGEVIAKGSPNLKGIENNNLLMGWAEFICFNPSFTYQFCNYMFRDAKLLLTSDEFAAYRTKVQKHYELLFLQNYLDQTVQQIKSLESNGRESNVSKIDHLKSRGFDLKDKIETILIESPNLISYCVIDDFEKCIGFFFNEEEKKYVSLTTANKFAFYRDVDISSVFNNTFLLYININIGYFNNNDTQGISSLNSYFMWYFKEKNKYKPRMQYLFEYLTTFCLVEVFLNIMHIIDITRDLVNERRSVSCDTSKFYHMQKNKLLNNLISKKCPESIRLDYKMLNNPLSDALTNISRNFDINSNLPNGEMSFAISNLEYDSENSVVIARLNPRNLYHAHLFLEHCGEKIFSQISKRPYLYDSSTLNYDCIKNFSDSSSSYFNKDTENFIKWYSNTFFDTFIFDYEVVSDCYLSAIDKCESHLDESGKKYFYSNLIIAKVLWFTKRKHKYLLEVLDDIYASINDNDEHLEDRLFGIFGYLIHLESALDHLVDMQGSKQAQEWIKSFIPVRLKQILEFETHQQYKDWKASILDYWETGLDHVYRGKVFHQQSRITSANNILLWFPLFSKKTANFDHGQWQAHILARMVKEGLRVNDADPKFWIMGEFLFDYAILDINIDNYKQREKALEIYKLFVQEYSYKDFVDFNEPQVVNNAIKFVNSMFPVDERIVLPAYNTSILHFLEQTKNRQDSMDLESNSAFRVQVRAKTRLIVNSTFLGAPIILSSTLKKGLEEFNFKTSNLYDPIKIQQTLLKYENYLEVLKKFDLDLIRVFEIYIQECNLCFLLNQHETLLLQLKKPNIPYNLYMTIVSCAVYIEDCISVDCKFYGESEFEVNYMYRRNKFERLDLGRLDVHECRDFFERHISLLTKVFPLFPLIFKDKSEGLMVEMLSHINTNKEIDLVHNNRLIKKYQRTVRLNKNLISSNEEFTESEKEACIYLYDFFHERAAFRANSEIFSMNEKAIELLGRFEFNSTDNNQGNLIKFS